MTLYATLDAAKGELNANSTLDDNKVLGLLRVVSRRVDRLFQSRRPYFAPYIEQDEWILDSVDINTAEYTYRFPRPLLSLSGVTVGSETLTAGTQVEAWPTLKTPYHKLRLMNYGRWYDYCANTNEWPLVQITGTWGYHNDWANAWHTITTLAAAISNTTGTSITLTNVDAANAWGITPGISAGSLIRIDSEYLEVTATNTTTNVATVRRGVNGSTAATHSNGASVAAFQVVEDVQQVVARQVGYLYARKGAYTTAVVDGMGMSTYPKDLIAELKGVLAGYAYNGY